MFKNKYLVKYPYKFRNLNQLKFSLNSDDMSISESQKFVKFLRKKLNNVLKINKNIYHSKTKLSTTLNFCVDLEYQINNDNHDYLINYLLKQFQNK